MNQSNVDTEYILESCHTQNKSNIYTAPHYMEYTSCINPDVQLFN